jgi:hypothetical protein
MGTYGKILGAAAPGPSWSCIEIWAPYVRQFGLDAIYDDVVVADARAVDFRTLGRVDLIIFGDVLEHMTKAEAESLVDKALSHARFVLISIPILFHPKTGLNMAGTGAR